MLKEKIINTIKCAIKEGSTLKNIAISASVGLAIAVSPTMPLQTLLIFLISYLIKLNYAVVFIMVYVVNNPLTMIPLYASGYMFGTFLFKQVLKIDLAQYNPSWADSFFKFICKYVDLKAYLKIETFEFWNLILGGSILAILVGIISYPIIKFLLKRLYSNEDNRTK